jgi:hypothetical protein
MNESVKRMTEEITAVIERGLREELLHQREAALEVELTAVRDEIDRLGGKVQTPPKAVKPVSAPVPAPKPVPANRPISNKSAHVLLMEVLKDTRRPMTIRELTNAIIRRGWQTARADPSKTVDVALRTNVRDFRRTSPGTFDLIR